MKKTAVSVLFAAALAATSACAADPGVTDTEIRIGDVNPMTGPVAIAGRSIALGTKIAAAEINDKGGVNGRMIKVFTEDDGYVPSRSFQALTKLIEVDKVFALNGTSGTANVLAMMPLITDHNLPVVVTSAPAEVVYTPVRPSVFTFGASYADDFYAQLKYIHERMQPANAVYGIIRQDDDLGREIERGYDRAVKQLGLKDGIRLAFKRGTTNFSAEVAQMKAAGVNVLANGAVFAGAANVLSEARKLGMDNLKSAGVRTEGIPASAKLSAPAGYNFMISDYVSITGAAAEEFEKLARKYVSPEEIGAISHYTYVTYLGLKVLAHAMGQCGKNLTRACTVENLRKIKNFETNGLSAPISFDNPKQLSGTAIALFQYDAAAGKFNQLTEFVNY